MGLQRMTKGQLFTSLKTTNVLVRISVKYNYSADKTTLSADEVLHKLVNWTNGPVEYDQNPSGFAFLCKLWLLLFKPRRDYQI